METVGEYLKACLKHWTAFLSGAFVSVGLLIVDALGASLSWWVYVGLIFLGFVFGSYKTWKAERDRADVAEYELMELRDVSLAIEFNPADSCVHRFQTTINDRYYDVFLYRIIVVNKSKTRSIENIRVTLDATEVPSSVLPLHLHQMHDNQKPYQRSFILHPGDRKHIDVVQYIHRNPICEIQSIDFDGKAIALNVEGVVKLTISASGTNVAKVSEDFEVKIDDAAKALSFFTDVFRRVDALLFIAR